MIFFLIWCDPCNFLVCSMFRWRATFLDTLALNHYYYHYYYYYYYYYYCYYYHHYYALFDTYKNVRTNNKKKAINIFKDTQGGFYLE